MRPKPLNPKPACGERHEVNPREVARVLEEGCYLEPLVCQLGFRVEGFGFKDLGFRVWGIWGLGDSGSLGGGGFRVLGFDDF